MTNWTICLCSLILVLDSFDFSRLSLGILSHVVNTIAVRTYRPSLHFHTTVSMHITIIFIDGNYYFSFHSIFTKLNFISLLMINIPFFTIIAALG